MYCCYLCLVCCRLFLLSWVCVCDWPRALKRLEANRVRVCCCCFLFVFLFFGGVGGWEGLIIIIYLFDLGFSVFVLFLVFFCVCFGFFGVFFQTFIQNMFLLNCPFNWSRFTAHQSQIHCLQYQLRSRAFLCSETQSTQGSCRCPLCSRSFCPPGLTCINGWLWPVSWSWFINSTVCGGRGERSSEWRRFSRDQRDTGCLETYWR